MGCNARFPRRSRGGGNNRAPERFGRNHLASDREGISHWRATIPDGFEKAKEVGEQIVEKREVRMFGRNTVASTFTFLLDLLILWSLVEFVGVPHVPAAVIAFIVPFTIFYFLQREWVFPGTTRGVATGFVYFAVIMGIGFVTMLATFWTLLQLTELHYLFARVLASVVYGIVVFVLNGVFNFKQL